MWSLIVSSLFLCSCISASKDEYDTLCTNLADVSLPVFSVDANKKAEELVLYYNTEAAGFIIEMLGTINIHADTARMEMVTLVLPTSQQSPINNFTRYLKTNKVLQKEVVKLVHSYTPTIVAVEKAFEFTIGGGISVTEHTTQKGYYIVVAIFEFNYSEEYSKIRESFGQSFPIYNSGLEIVAKSYANAQLPGENLEEFKAMFAEVNGYRVLLVLAKIPVIQKDTERIGMRRCLETLLSKSAWDKLVTHEQLSALGYGNLTELLGSNLPTGGACSISLKKFQPDQMAANTLNVFNFCAYIQLNKVQ